MGTPIHRFHVGHDDGAGRMYFEVRLFADEAAMREHYRRSSVLAGRKAAGENDGWLAETAAMCCPRSTGYVDRAGELTWWPIIGYILFPLQHVTTPIVTHELVHAALTYYRERRWRTGHPSAANFGDHCSSREEDLGHIFSGLVAEMTDRLYERGLWGSEASP